MPTAAGYTKADSGIYFYGQSAKGVIAATPAFKGAMGVTDFEDTNSIQRVDGVPMLGAGFYPQKSAGYAVQTTLTASGWMTLDTLPAFLLANIATKGATTGAGPNYTHPYTVVTKNASKKYVAIAIVRGETAPGTGILTQLYRDCVMTKLTLSVPSNGYIGWTASWTALNFGPGVGDAVFSFNNSFNNPNPNNASNTFTLPAFFGANTCLNSLTVDWTGETSQGQPCLIAGEYPDTIINRAHWELGLNFQGDANTVAAFQHILYKTVTPPSNSSAFVAGLKEGAFSFLVNTDNFITGSIPYSLAMSFPSLQWTEADWVNGSPNTFAVKAMSFASDATATVVNASASAAMVI